MDMMRLQTLTAGGVFAMVVNYAKTLAAFIEAGCFDGVHNDPTKDEGYDDRKMWGRSVDYGERSVSFELFDGTEHHDQDYMEAAMKRAGCRPANAKELLAFAEKNPEIQRQFQIVALEFTFVPTREGFILAWLTGDGEKREVTFEVSGKPHGGTWPDCLFLGVKV